MSCPLYTYPLLQFSLIKCPCILISKDEFEKEGLRKVRNKESKSLTDFIPISISSVYGKLQILHFLYRAL